VAQGDAVRLRQSLLGQSGVELVYAMHQFVHFACFFHGQIRIGIVVVVVILIVCL
jgi:hypothetical protein